MQGDSLPICAATYQADAGVLGLFDQLDEVTFTQAWRSRLPAETYDHIVSTSGGPGNS